MRRRLLLPVSALAAAALAVPAFAVSDGGYDYTRQGCTSNAENTTRSDQTEPHCYSITVTISDGSHRYFLVGVPMTKDGQHADALETCLDLTGTPQCARVDQSGFTPIKPWFKSNPPDPASGELHVYFGMDDNIDNGEHDSSHYVDNGPSDGGAIQANAAPLSAPEWLAGVTGKDGRTFLLTHPLPVADGGAGFCADGICLSAQTQRRTAYTGSGKHVHSRDVADYEGHQWDPQTCAGPSDTKKDCGGHDIRYWDRQNGRVYVEPGIQVYEDPDPQGSPEFVNYPLPALYVGTCGLVVGGGDVQAPPSPYTNSAGQLVVKTC